MHKGDQFLLLTARNETDNVHCGWNGMLMVRSDSDMKAVAEAVAGEQSGPLNERLVRALERLIAEGRLKAGDQLPATRELAGRLGWHRSTVIQAYNKLAQAGLLDSGVGRGTFVRAAELPAAGDEPFSWSNLAQPDGGSLELERALAREAPLPAQGDPIRLTGAIPDPALFPLKEVRRLTREVLETHGAEALNYGPTEGWPPLREQIARRLAAEGVPADPDSILIVQGSQQGLDLILRRLVRPGETVAFESPTYAQALSLFRYHGARLLPIPMDEDGLRTDMLARAAGREPVRLLYTMSTFHNPTGLSQSAERRREVLRIAAGGGFPVLEDHFDAELRYRGEALPCLKAFDERDQVVLLGTFSKILFPGLRVGWILAPKPIFDSLSRLMRAAALSTSLMAQIILAEFCRRGMLDRHLERVRRVYAGRQAALLQALQRHLPPEVRWTRPDGGMTLWITLPPGIDGVSVTLEARRRGVLVTPGNFFHVEGGAEHLALSSTFESEERLEKGARVLGEILRRAVTKDRERGPKTIEVGPIV
ncbi:MAG: aminotransferase class I/II-fold pyridoxal phosphate-dependent enzyme [Candidatus Eisenbacteria bacterium]|nr:aminotransferase class I/II-fold pyridoxal phosphate-dependent enzyme [Candidatus Eisenbacteria bacterium]